MKSIDRARIEAFVDAAGERLDGDWLLVGGAFVALRFESRRITEDIDIIGMRGTQEERWALMDLALALGLPVEAVNSAADFFVFRIDGWRDMTEVLHRGSRATIHGPDPTLFLLLKVGRLSERDLADCLGALAHARAAAQPVDVARVIAALDAAKDVADPDLVRRREQLRRTLAT